MAVIHKKVYTSHFTKGLRSTGGPDLLKWGLPGGGVKSAKVAPTPYVYFPPCRGGGHSVRVTEPECREETGQPRLGDRFAGLASGPAG